MNNFFNADYCQFRLPCGLCLKTNSPCMYSHTIVTCSTETTDEPISIYSQNIELKNDENDK